MSSNNHSKIPDPIEALMVILAVFFTISLTAFIYMAPLDVTNIQSEVNRQSRYFFIFAGSLFFILPFAYLYYKKMDVKKLLRLNPVSMQTLVYSAFLAVSIYVLGDELDRLINWIIPTPEWLTESIKPLKAETISDWILVVLGAVVVASVAEETAFRGFFQTALEKKGDVTRAVMLSSAAWALIHMNPYWAVQIFTTGIFMGYLSWKTNSIYPSILVHALNNLIAILFLNFEEIFADSWYEFDGHVSPLLLVASTALLLGSIKKI
jgi:membrane protease YdiL (CAAX protease family)